MNQLTRLSNFPLSRDLLKLKASERLNGKMLDLVLQLKINLTDDALKISKERLKESRWKTILFSAIFLIATILGVFAFLYILMLFSSDQPWQNQKIFKQVLLITSIIFLSAIYGIQNWKKTIKATSNALHSIAEPFLNKEMEDRWEHFRAWAKAKNIVIYVELASSEFIPIPIEIWQKSFALTFILGSKEHRRLLVDGTHHSLAPLVIKAKDWKRYEKTLPKVDLIKTTTSQNDKINNDYKLSRPAPSSNKVENLAKAKPAASKTGSKRTTRAKGAIKPVKRVSKAKLTPQKKISQSKVSRKPKKLEKPHARTCLRSVMMCEGYKYLLKYKEKEVKPLLLKASDKAAHDVLLVMEKNFSSLSLYFSDSKKTPEEQVLVDKLTKDIEEALQVGARNHTRIKEFKTKGWRHLEKYIERQGIISSEEVASFFKLHSTS